MRAFYRVAIFSCGGLAGVHFVHLLSRIEIGTLLPSLLGLLLGIAAADLLTAAVHWACDTWGGEQTPWLGHSLIHSFREHHRQPSAMLEHDWIEVNGGASAAGLFALIVFTASSLGSDLASSSSNLSNVFATTCFLSLVGTSAITNQLHYWAHVARPPAIVRWLQNVGLILSPARHALHHRAPHMHGYCISTGWLNRPLDTLGFWRGLEWGLAALTRVEPRKGEMARE